MKMKSNKVDIGDVIQSEYFANGYYKDPEKIPGIINVNDSPQEEYVMGYLSKPKNVLEDRVKKAKKGDLGEWLVDYSAFDESRKEALYVVEHAEISGGGTGHGPHDVFPDGWLVQARKLNPDTTYNPKEELIEFYQSGCFTDLIKTVEVVGKMEKTFVKFTPVKLEGK